jgi:hypothetical protein
VPICAEETATGTNINRVVCRTREQADDEKTTARDWRSRSGRDPIRPAATRGGFRRQ